MNGFWHIVANAATAFFAILVGLIVAGALAVAKWPLGVTGDVRRRAD